jgi:hypothetical protein
VQTVVSLAVRLAYADDETREVVRQAGRMHAADREAWGAVERGEREIDWPIWFGHPDGADYLTDQGKALAGRAAADLTRFFGRSWLDRAMRPGTGRTVRELGARSPVFAFSEVRAVEAYVEAIRWWASLQLLVDMRVDGIGAVRRDARNDVSTQRFAHTLVQARLAAIGASVGADVRLEPGKTGGPGDVLLRRADSEVFLEIVTFGPDQSGELQDIAFHRHFEQLTALARTEMYWEGHVPGFLHPADEDAWQSAVADAAERCNRTHSPAPVEDRWGDLVARPGRAPEGSQLTGPDVGTDAGPRLASLLAKKARQIRHAGTAWIWVEDRGGMHPIAPFAGMPLPDKLGSLARLVEPVLADHPHLGGVAWSAVTRRSLQPRNDHALGHSGIALRRGLPIQGLRETVIVNRRLILPYQTRFLAQVCDREPGWLDWALKRLGAPPLSDVVAAPVNIP